jgi:hypothetical protein
VDLVLSDVVMPQLNGVQLLEALSVSHPGLPVLLMSGYAVQDLGGRSAVGLARGASSWLDSACTGRAGSGCPSATPQGTPGQSRGRKATDPRLLRDAPSETPRRTPRSPSYRMGGSAMLRYRSV